MSTIPEGKASTTPQLPRRLLPARVDEDLCLKQKWYYGFPIRYTDYDKRLKGKKGRLTDRMFAVEVDFYHICAEVLPEWPGREGARVRLVRVQRKRPPGSKFQKTAEVPLVVLAEYRRPSDSLVPPAEAIAQLKEKLFQVGLVHEPGWFPSAY